MKTANVDEVVDAYYSNIQGVASTIHMLMLNYIIYHGIINQLHASIIRIIKIVTELGLEIAVKIFRLAATVAGLFRHD